LSQGLPKKIEFDLLPADLTFQLGNLLARSSTSPGGSFGFAAIASSLRGRPLPRRASGPPARKRVRQ
jgi:hypothetical protein